nr:radical SAM protein [uncultured Acetatifactor sp.]
MIIDDNKGFLTRIQHKARQSVNESAVLFGGRIQDAILSLDELIDAEPYVKVVSQDKIELVPAFLLGTVRAMIKSGRELVFLHTHPRQTDLQFSVVDRKFEQDLIRLSSELGYEGSFTFLVASGYDIKGRIYQGDSEEAVSFLADNQWVQDVEILSDDKLAKGLLYQTRTNDMVRVSRETAQYLKELQEECSVGKADSHRERIAEERIKDIFGNNGDIFLKPIRHSAETHMIEKLEILIQNGCNLNCKYCYAAGGSYGRKTEILSPDQGRKIIRTLAEQGIRRIGMVLFFGGEPSAYPETIEAICEACEEQVKTGVLEKSPEYSMISNGFLLSEMCMQTIRRYHIHLTVSMDGPEEIHDSLRRGKYGEKTHGQVLKNIEQLKELSAPPVMLEATYTSVHEAAGISREQTASILREETGIRNIYVCDCKGSRLEPERETKEQILLKERAEIDRLFQRQEYCDELTDLMSFVIRCGKILSKTEREDALCEVGFRSFTIDSTGDIYPCHFFVGNASFQLGNIFEPEYLKEGKGTAEIQLRRYTKSENESCRKCWIRNFCDRCIYQLYQTETGGDSKDRFVEGCEVLRNRYRMVILHLMNRTKEERKELYDNILSFLRVESEMKGK